MKNFSISNKDLIVFFVVTFGLTILMGFVMGIVYEIHPVGSFPLLQMYYPALGVMVALLLNKDLRSKIPIKFFYTYMVFLIASIVYILVKLFFFHQDPETDLTFLLFINSLALIVAYNSDKNESIRAFGLKFKENFKESIPYIFLFIILYMLCLFVSSLVGRDVGGFISPFTNVETWIRLFLLPIGFILTYPVFLGEEYGWRYFLQPALQERMGKRKAVIVLGLIWGIWHLPINLFYYSPQTSLYSILNQVIVCTGYSIFFGYVYMKSRNIWIISIIHFLNNNMGAIIYEATGNDLVFSWEAILFKLILFSVVYGPFLLARVYKNVRVDIEG